jgi:hypothetical protein
VLLPVRLRAGQHVGRDAIGLLLEAVLGLRHRQPVADVASTDATGALLRHMHRLMGQERFAVTARAGVPRVHDDVVTAGISLGPQRRGRGGVGVHPHAGEILSQPGFHSAPQQRR